MPTFSFAALLVALLTAASAQTLNYYSSSNSCGGSAVRDGALAPADTSARALLNERCAAARVLSVGARALLPHYMDVLWVIRHPNPGVSTSAGVGERVIAGSCCGVGSRHAIPSLCDETLLLMSVVVV